jgi:hypothetical protein
VHRYDDYLRVFRQGFIYELLSGSCWFGLRGSTCYRGDQEYRH